MHPKARRAASQEAWPNTGQTLGNAAQARCDRSNIGAIFAKFRAGLTHIWQGIAEAEVLTGTAMASAAVGPGAAVLHGRRGRPPGHPVLHHASGAWHSARLFAANVDSTPGCLVSDSDFPSAHAGSGRRQPGREGLHRFAPPLSFTWSIRCGMACCARAVQ